MESVYDSPTFLSQKDKYFMGLSLVQMMGVVVIAFMMFFVSLMLPVGLLVRVGCVGVATLVISCLVFGRIGGLLIPSYMLLMLLAPMRRTVYEEELEVLLAGSDEFLAALEEKEARALAHTQGGGDRGSGEGWLRRGKDFATSEENANRRNEMMADVNKGMVEGASSLEGMVKDGLRNLKGG